MSVRKIVRRFFKVLFIKAINRSNFKLSKGYQSYYGSAIQRNTNVISKKEPAELKGQASNEAVN